MVETQENIEKKISKLLDDFQESEASLVNQYNQEYQILKDTVVRMNQLDNDVVDLKALKELNTKWQFWQIIAFLILSSCIGMYNFINDLDSFSLGQIIATLFPLFFYNLTHPNLFGGFLSSSLDFCRSEFFLLDLSPTRFFS